MAERPIFLLIDGHALIYRAFYAFPGLTAPDGRLINAVYGFTRILLKAIAEYEPKYLAVTFDHPTPTFRHQDFAGYKAHRAEMPDELKPQVEIIKQVVAALNIPQFELAGFEADDLIGTISCQLDQKTDRKRWGEVLTVIVTGDRDAFQLVDDNTHVWLPARGKFQTDKEYDSQAVMEKMGVTPKQIIDLKALMGDSSDDIPGVKGIGPKTAVGLVQAFDNIENLYMALESQNNSVDVADKVKAAAEVVLSPDQEKVLTKSVRQKLSTDKDNAFLSKKLATIDCQAPIELDLSACVISSYDKEAAIAIFKELDFGSLIHMLPVDEFEASVQQALF
ncbi:MAG: 5'-3' exonuclease [Patescibacteria group bacterium]